MSIPCYYRSTVITNDSLETAIGKYVNEIEEDALPVMAIVKSGDTTQV